MTREALFRPWVERIARLRTWGRPLTDVPVRILARDAEHSSGLAYRCPRRIVVTLGTDPVDAIATILHEYAHAAAANLRDAEAEAHGLAFQERLRAATLELCGVDPGLLGNYRVFQRSVEDAVSFWWRAHHAAAWTVAERFARNGG